MWVVSFLFRLIPLGLVTALWIMQTSWFWSWLASGLVPGLVVEKANQGLVPLSLHLTKCSHPLGVAEDVEIRPDWGHFFQTFSWRLSVFRVGLLDLHADNTAVMASEPPFRLIHNACKLIRTWDISWKQDDELCRFVRDDQQNVVLTFKGNTYTGKLRVQNSDHLLTLDLPGGVHVQAALMQDGIDVSIPDTTWRGHVASDTWMVTDGSIFNAHGTWKGVNIQGEVHHPWVGVVRGSYNGGTWHVEPFSLLEGTVQVTEEGLSFQKLHWQECVFSGKLIGSVPDMPWRVDAKTPMGAASIEGHMDANKNIVWKGLGPHQTLVKGVVQPVWADVWKSSISCEGDIHTTLQQLPTGLDENNVIQGDVHAHLAVQGTLDQPQISGFVDVKNGLYHNIECGVWLSPIHIRLRGSGNTWVVEACTASDRSSRGNEIPRGGVKGSGRFTFSPDKPLQPIWDVTLNLDEVDIAHGDRFQGDASGELHLVGSEARIEGHVTLNRASVHLDAMDDAEDVKVVRDNSRSSKVERTDHFAPMDFTLVAPGPIVVDGMGFDSTWKGQMHIKGYITKPQLVGEITCQKGTMNVLGIPMNVEGSRIGYIEEDFNMPQLGITATHMLDAQQKILFSVTGTSDRPVAHFTSNVGLSERDVVSRLLFGQSADSISVWQSLQLANILANLGNRKNKMSWMEQLRHTFGIDSFEVKSVETDRGTTAQTPRIGKKIGGLRVSVDAATNATPSKATVETFILPNVSVNADMGGDKSSGVGVDWVYHY